MNKNNMFRQVDLAFVVDTTGSMGSFIAEAQRNIVTLLKELVKANDLDLQVGVVWYKDHCDEEVVKAYGFTGDMQKAHLNIMKLDISGGGDEPEAVFDGLKAMYDKLQWREHSKKIAILVGDAPPHGYMHEGRDEHPRGCPCGLTMHEVTGQMEEKGIVLNAIVVSESKSARESFGETAAFTGGELFVSRYDALDKINELLNRSFETVDFDIDIYHKIIEMDSISAVADAKKVGRYQVSAAVSRLMSRKLLNYDIKKDKYVGCVG